MKDLFKKSAPIAFAVAAIVSFAPFSDCSASSCNSTRSEYGMKADKNIVQIAQANSDFSTLVAALVAADLVPVLEGQGPFTVFAPTNEAFAKLPAGTLESLLLPENKDKLAAILTYHVIPGKVLAADVTTMMAKTVNGKDIDIQVNGSNVTVNNATVVKTDIVGTNGVIHVIDTVLLP